jgi:hypothetical protein
MTETFSGVLFVWTSRIVLAALVIGVWLWVLREKVTPAAHRSSPRLAESLKGFPLQWVSLATGLMVVAYWYILV